MSEKLCLKWNDFQENVTTAFGSLKEDNKFTDVTLACEDGQQIEAHKVILAACSPFFENLLNKNAKKHHHPLIYMKGMKFEDLHAIIDFLYLGEANIFQESLDSFLNIAEDLKLKGLTGKGENSNEKFDTKSKHPAAHQPMNLTPLQKRQRQKIDRNTDNLTEQTFPLQTFDEQKVALPNFLPGDLQRLDEKVKSMMEVSQSIIGKHGERAKVCKVCGKEGQSMAIRDHIEGHHLEGVSLPCNVCGRDFRSRSNLRKHTCIPI